MKSITFWVIVIFLGFNYSLSAQIDCGVGSGLVFLVNDDCLETDGDGVNGEQVCVTNPGPMDVNIGSCTFVAFDPLLGEVTNTATLPPQVLLVGTTVAFNTTFLLPPNFIPDGPGAVLLVHGTVSIGDSFEDMLPNIVASLVYESEDNVLVNYDSATDENTNELQAIIASLARPIPTIRTWGLIVLTILLLIIAIIRIKQLKVVRLHIHRANISEGN